MHTNHRLPLPKNQTAFVLHTILNKGNVSEQELRINGFRARISSLILKHELPIRHRVVKFTNRFKRQSQFREHYLLKKDFPQAIRLYNQINRA